MTKEAKKPAAKVVAKPTTEPQQVVHDKFPTPPPARKTPPPARKTVQTRYRELQDKFRHQKPVPDAIRLVEEALAERHLIVLPTVRRKTYSTAKKPNGEPVGMTELEVTFSFMDDADCTYVEATTIGICLDKSEYPSNSSITCARQNALVCLFLQGIPLASAPEEKPVTTPEVEPETSSGGPGAAEVVNVNIRAIEGVTTADQIKEKPTPGIVENRHHGTDLYRHLATTDTVNVVAESPEPKRPTKKEVADQTQLLLNWQAGCALLDLSDLSTWYAHRDALRDMTFLDNSERLTLFQKWMDSVAPEVAYDYKSLQFYYPAPQPA